MAAPEATRVNERVLERWRIKVSFCLFVLFLINLGVYCRGAGQIWKDWELSSGVHDVKFPKS